MNRAVGVEHCLSGHFSFNEEKTHTKHVDYVYHDIVSYLKIEF